MPLPVTNGGGDAAGTSQGAVPTAAGLWPPVGLDGLTWKETRVTFAVNIVRLAIPAAPSRVFVMLAPPLPDLFTYLAHKVENLASNIGYIADGRGPFIRSWAQHGPLSTMEFWGRTATAHTALLMEVFYAPAPKGIVQAAVERPITHDQRVEDAIAQLDRCFRPG